MYKFKWIVCKLESVLEARFEVKKARISTILKNEDLKVEYEKRIEIDFFFFFAQIFLVLFLIVPTMLLLLSHFSRVRLCVTP